MKKLISLIIIVTMMVLTLTSCDLANKVLENFNKDSSNEQNNEQENESDKTVDNNIYTITEKEWEAHDTITNYTMNAYITTTVTRGDESATITAKMIYKSCENAIYEKIAQTSHSNENIGIYIVSQEIYYTINEGKRYFVSQDQDGKWTATESDWKLDSISEYFYLSEQIEFEDLTYDAELKAYTYTHTRTYENREDVFTMRFYFKNGTVTRIYEKVVNHYDDGETESEIFDAEISSIGVTHVIIPQLVRDEVTYN